MFRLKSAVMAAKVWNVIHTLRIFCVSTSTEAIPMERNRPIEPRRVSKGSTNNTLILSTVAALAVLTAIFVVYSYKVSEKVDTAATERATPPAATTGSEERPPTTSNVPPATAPSPQR